MVGIDLEEVKNINFSQVFIDKIANQEECDYIRKSKCESLQKQRLTALFCAKEAVAKALGTGIGKTIGFKDIVLMHEESGKPFIKLQGKAGKYFQEKFSGKQIEISLSHTENYAVAVAMIV